jgi:hypothetical protein
VEENRLQAGRPQKERGLAEMIDVAEEGIKQATVVQQLAAFAGLFTDNRKNTESEKKQRDSLV